MVQSSDTDTLVAASDAFVASAVVKKTPLASALKRVLNKHTAVLMGVSMSTTDSRLLIKSMASPTRTLLDFNDPNPAVRVPPLKEAKALDIKTGFLGEDSFLSSYLQQPPISDLYPKLDMVFAAALHKPSKEAVAKEFQARRLLAADIHEIELLDTISSLDIASASLVESERDRIKVHSQAKATSAVISALSENVLVRARIHAKQATELKLAIRKEILQGITPIGVTSALLKGNLYCDNLFTDASLLATNECLKTLSVHHGPARGASATQRAPARQTQRPKTSAPSDPRLPPAPPARAGTAPPNERGHRHQAPSRPQQGQQQSFRGIPTNDPLRYPDRPGPSGYQKPSSSGYKGRGGRPSRGGRGGHNRS